MKSTLLIPALLLVSMCAALAQSIPVFPRQGTIWKYNQTDDVYTATGGTGWTALNYNDSGPSWQQGPALLSSEGDAGGNVNIQPLIGTAILAPRLSLGGTPPVSHARFFRRKFTYNGPSGPYTILRMNERIDDSAFFWLNGNYIGALRTAGPPDYDWQTRGALLPCGGDADCENTIDLVLTNGTELVQGDNIIAVSVHQTGSDSSDITFGFSLDVVPSRSVTILSNSEPRDRVIVQNRSTTLNVYVDASPAPTYQWYFSTSASGPFAQIQDATNSPYTIASMQPANEGYYYATAGNIINSVTSRTAHVTFTTDTTAPVALGAIAPNFTSVTVQFNEGMDAGTTGDLFGWGVMDDIGGSYEVTAVTLSGDASIARLALATALPEDTLITVSISGPADLAGNAMTDTNLTFRTFTTAGCGSLLFESYDTATTPGVAISLLTNHPNYPNHPMEVYRLPNFDTRNVYPSGSPDPVGRPNQDAREQFGGRVRGLFVPYASGPWTFYLAADDDAELFLNPSGPDPAGKQLVANQDGIACCLEFQPMGNPRTSVPINLTAGQAYYIEGLYKEAGGGDWLKVVAQPSGDPVPTHGADANILGTAISGGPGPADILNFVTIGSQPANTNVIAGQTATFQVKLSPDVPGCFQWKRNGVDIPGAVGPTYWLVGGNADDGAKFRCAISLMGGTTLLSAEATLGVSIDVTPPRVTNVATDTARTNITLTFSEPMETASSTATGNYSIPGVTVQGATLSNPTTVQLRINPALTACQAYTLSITGVRDANAVAIVPTNVTFTGSILLLDWDAATTWRYWEVGTQPAGSWADRTYDDSAWKSGAAVLAYETATYVGESPIRTVLAAGTATNTAYFRAHFNLNTDPSTVTSLQIRQIMDDGGVYYVNGTEVYRSRMNAGAVTHTTLANAGGPEPVDGTHTTEGPLDALTSSLRYGDNVLAVELHPSSVTSSDSVFGAQLQASVTRCVTPIILSVTRNGNQITITSSAGGTIYKNSSLTGGTWTSVGTAPQTVTIGPGNQFFEIR